MEVQLTQEKENKRKSSSGDALSIVMISMSRWDGPFSSASISLAKEFAKTHKVYYVDHPLTLLDIWKSRKLPMLKHRLKALFLGKDSLTSISNNLAAFCPYFVFPVNWLPKGFLYKWANQLNNYIFFKSLKRLLKEEKVEDFIFFNSYNPFYGYELPEDIRPAKFVYQSRDDISESLYVAKHGVTLEKQVILNADKVMATSSYLARKITPKNGKYVHHLPNSADLSLFDHEALKSCPKPDDIAAITKPIVLYTGNIQLRINYDLLYNTALNHPDKQFVMIGPRNDKGHHKLDFDSLSNVSFLGAKPIDQLGYYMAHADCAIIPFKCNELTRSIYPLKVNEYLAMGLPVVSTNFSEDISRFEKVVYLAEDSVTSFSDLINRAIAENGMVKVEQRKEVAKQNTWSKRVEQFWELLEA
ncbi:glycosyltransferase [Limibacter armeniacum]|uniref:glycosyltransferase n=1 Tax=Limibacter armeniacum TaxID=466084 RepID=UPI002FE51A45